MNFTGSVFTSLFRKLSVAGVKEIPALQHYCYIIRLYKLTGLFSKKKVPTETTTNLNEDFEFQLKMYHGDILQNIKDHNLLLIKAITFHGIYSSHRRDV